MHGKQINNDNNNNYCLVIIIIIITTEIIFLSIFLQQNPFSCKTPSAMPHVLISPATYSCKIYLCHQARLSPPPPPPHSHSLRWSLVRLLHTTVHLLSTYLSEPTRGRCDRRQEARWVKGVSEFKGNLEQEAVIATGFVSQKPLSLGLPGRPAGRGR